MDYGSFVSTKENPSDIDTLTEFDGEKIDENNDKQRINDLIDNSKSKTNGLCHSLKVYRYPATDEEKYKFNNTKNSTINLLELNFNSLEDLLIEEISKGSYNIKFSFPNPTEEDVKRTSPRKKGLMKIFDFINCGDDIEKLKKEAGPNGKEALRNYKGFIYEIVKNKADFTLDTELGTVKAGLTLEQCKNICENLNV